MTDVKAVVLTPELHAYLLDHSVAVDDVQQWLIDTTGERMGEMSRMQIAPEQGAFLTLLTSMIGARSAVEVGTFTGYSSLCIARGLAPGGHLLCCDVSEDWTAIAREAWERAGVADRVELRIAPALETLRALPEEPTIDLVFIDADKVNYISYWEELVPRVRPGGVLLVDNVLWSGNVINPEATDDNTAAIRGFNTHVREDPRVEQVILPLADGVTFARKR